MAMQSWGQHITEQSATAPVACVANLLAIPLVSRLWSSSTCNAGRQLLKVLGFWNSKASGTEAIYTNKQVCALKYTLLQKLEHDCHYHHQEYQGETAGRKKSIFTTVENSHTNNLSQPK
jgi:hypothetical protein